MTDHVIHITEHPSVVGEIYCVVHAQCAACGVPTEGRVASSRKDSEDTRCIARAWAQELELGVCELLCPACCRKARG